MAPAKHSRKSSPVRNRYARKARASRREVVRDHLRGHLRNLRLVRCVITVSSELLKHQNVDYDADIAQLLQHDAGDRLDVEIDRTQSLIDTVARSPT